MNKHIVSRLMAVSASCYGLLLSGCGTPNNVTLTFTPNLCVQYNQYSSAGQAILATIFPQIINNPTYSSACMAVTITNNNSGQNANNIQTTINGLQVSFNVGSQYYGATMGDNAATNNGLGYTQQIGNLALFDPNNCATTQGNTVITIDKNGGTCTFYFELLSDNNPVGVYPIGITYNYSNGNTQNLYLTTTINQRVYLYGGTNNGLYYESGLAANNTAQWESTGILADTDIKQLFNLDYSNILLASESIAYSYNGESSIVQLGDPITATFNQFTFESTNQTIYAATTSGVYAYAENESDATWQLVNDAADFVPATSDILAIDDIESTSSVLSLTTESMAYICAIESVATIIDCESYSSVSQSAAPSQFFLGTLANDNSGNLYAGTVTNESFGVSAALTGTSVWESQYTYQTPITQSAYTDVGGFTVLNSQSAGALVYFSLLPSDASESSLYYCLVSSGICNSVISSAANPINGGIHNIIFDGGGNLYVAGDNLNSLDWDTVTTESQNAATLQLNGAAVPTSQWAPIIGNNAITHVHALAVNAMLTTY